MRQRWFGGVNIIKSAYPMTSVGLVMRFAIGIKLSHSSLSCAAMFIDFDLAAGIDLVRRDKIILEHL
jgi:hypothetical protein